MKKLANVVTIVVLIAFGSVIVLLKYPGNYRSVYEKKKPNAPAKRPSAPETPPVEKNIWLNIKKKTTAFTADDDCKNYNHRFVQTSNHQNPNPKIPWYNSAIDDPRMVDFDFYKFPTA
jgi:hypothetical protein